MQQQKQTKQQKQSQQNRQQQQPRQNPRIQLSKDPLSRDGALAQQISQQVRRELRAKHAQGQQHPSARGRSPQQHPKPHNADPSPQSADPKVVSSAGAMLSPTWASEHRPRSNSHSPCRRIEVEGSGDTDRAFRAWAALRGFRLAVSQQDLSSGESEHSASVPEKRSPFMAGPRDRRSYSETSTDSPKATPQRRYPALPQVILSPSVDDDEELSWLSDGSPPDSHLSVSHPPGLLEPTLYAYPGQSGSMPAGLDLSSSAPAGLLSTVMGGRMQRSRSTDQDDLSASFNCPGAARRKKNSGNAPLQTIMQWMGLSPRSSPRGSPTSSRSPTPTSGSSNTLSPSSPMPAFSHMVNSATMKPSLHCQ